MVVSMRDLRSLRETVSDGVCDTESPGSNTGVLNL